jgi:hypothetical protein
MIDREVELQWESNNTLPLIQPDNNKMKFIELKVIQITPLVDEQMDYAEELESTQRLGIKRPELPESLKPVIGTRSFNIQHFTVLSWSSVWDKDFDREIIIADILWSTGMVETINLSYSKKEWQDILSTNWT